MDPRIRIRIHTKMSWIHPQHWLVRYLGPDAEIIVGGKLWPLGLVGVDHEEGVHVAQHDDGDGAKEEHLLPQLVTACNHK
jgi:hypothetical protein